MASKTADLGELALPALVLPLIGLVTATIGAVSVVRSAIEHRRAAELVTRVKQAEIDADKGKGMSTTTMLIMGALGLGAMFMLGGD